MARRVSQRELMSSEHFRRIQQNANDIEENLNTDLIVDFLFSEKILDRVDMDELRRPRPRPEKARLLISKLLMRGPRAFEVFVTALKQKGYGKLAATLTGSEEGSTSSETITQQDDMGDILEELRSRIRNLEIYAEGSYLTQNEFKGTLTKEIQAIKEITQKIQALTSNDSLLKMQLEEKNTLLESAKQKIEALENKVQKLEVDNESLKGALAEVKMTADGAKAQCKEIEKKLEEGQKKTDTEVQALARQIKMLSSNTTKTPRHRFQYRKK